jgi:hypothetical protein
MSDTTSQIAELLDTEIDEEVDTSDQVLGEEDETEEEDLEETSEKQEGDVGSWGEALGIEDDKLVLDENGTVAGVKVKVDGEESVVPLKELVAGYSFNAYNTQKAQQLAKERLDFIEQQKQFQQKTAAELQTHEQLANAIAQQVLGEYATIDWTRLEQERPQDARVLRAEYAEKRQYFSKLINAVQEEQSTAQQAVKAQQEQEFAQYLQNQKEIALTLVPEWTDKEVLRKDFENIKTVMSEYGFSDQELEGVQDARIFPLLRDLAKLKGALNNVNKTVQQGPKIKHGNNGNTNASKVNRLVKQARSTTNNYQAQQLKTSAVAELLKGAV